MMMIWCKGWLTETDTQTIRLGATPSGLTSAHLHHTHPNTVDVTRYFIQPYKIRTRQKRLRCCLIWAMMLMSYSSSASTSGALSRISSLSASNTISFSRSTPITSPATFLCWTHKCIHVSRLVAQLGFNSTHFPLNLDYIMHLGWQFIIQIYTFDGLQYFCKASI